MMKTLLLCASHSHPETAFPLALSASPQRANCDFQAASFPHDADALVPNSGSLQAFAARPKGDIRSFATSSRNDATESTARCDVFRRKYRLQSSERDTQSSPGYFRAVDKALRARNN